MLCIVEGNECVRSSVAIPAVELIPSAESHSKRAVQREAAQLREQLPVFMHVTNSSVMHKSGTPFTQEHEYKSPLKY